ncbi:MAG: hypothetical protein F6K62_17430, partial [Sphaerospermopsis sp. SIO1G2]|nr:hypothetical protein [Sphaerospermopsis sp. SIO1G2]
MTNSYDTSYKAQPFFTTQRIILLSIFWAVLALLYFLLFSANVELPPLPSPVQVNINPANIDSTELRVGRPIWYSYGTYVFE